MGSFMPKRMWMSLKNKFFFASVKIYSENAEKYFILVNLSSYIKKKESCIKNGYEHIIHHIISTRYLNNIYFSPTETTFFLTTAFLSFYLFTNLFVHPLSFTSAVCVRSGIPVTEIPARSRQTKLF